MKWPRKRVGQDYFRGDTSTTEKVIAMRRRGKSDRFIADYIGLPVERIEAIGSTALLPEGHERWADPGEPLSGIEDIWARRDDAKAGSAALLEAMLRAM